MTNKEKFIEVFGEEPQRQHVTKSWCEQEYVPPIIINLDFLEEQKSEEVVELLDKLRDEVLEYIDDLDIADAICEVFDKYRAESEDNGNEKRRISDNR